MIGQQKIMQVLPEAFVLRLGMAFQQRSGVPSASASM
jgi:hypothetical protein